MLERCGSVLFDKKMTNPRGAITRNQSQWKQPPSAGNNKVDHAGYSCTCAQQMKQAGRGLTVFSHVVRPEFAE